MARSKKKTLNDFSIYYGQVLKIRWEDVSGIDEGSIKEADKPVYFDSYGICVNETKLALILCSMMPGDEKEKEYRNLVRIPKRSIDSIVFYKEDKNEDAETF